MTIETQDPYEKSKRPPATMAEAIRGDLAAAKRGLSALVQIANTVLHDGEARARQLWVNRRENLDRFTARAKAARAAAANESASSESEKS